jgi:hypothetical protein
MKRTFTLAAGLMLASSLAMAQETRKPDCTKGDPWRLPAVANAETPVKVDGGGRLVLVCNCTVPGPQHKGSVWVMTATDVKALRATAKRPAPKADIPQPPSNTVSAYLLPAGSCGTVGTSNIILRESDSSVETWGISMLLAN